jgi:plasmid replication initiation protein
MSELIISKSNELIESYIFNATELELQILNYAVAKLNPKWDNNGIIFKVTISELVNTFGMQSKDAYRLYREALSRLMKREYKIQLENEKDWTENLVIGYGSPKDKSYLEFKFNEHISHHLSKLKEFFTSYDIKHIASFKSRYSFILYENFKMNVEKNKNMNYWSEEVSIQKLRKNLDLVNKYKAFNLLRINVIDKAKSEINQHSDILMDFEIKKTGRTPTSIIFKVKRKTDKGILKNKQTPSSKLEKSLSQKEINQRKKIIQNMDTEELTQFMENRQTKSKNPQSTKINNTKEEKTDIKKTGDISDKTKNLNNKKEKTGLFKRIFGN